MIATAMHHFGLPFSEAFWKMSYRKLILLSGSVPGYEEEESKNKDEKMDIKSLIASSGGRVIN